MNLKFDSFFVKKYLQINNPYRVPTNVCELAKAFALVTFLYALTMKTRRQAIYMIAQLLPGECLFIQA